MSCACGCGSCGPAVRAAALRGDPNAMRMLAARTPEGIGGLLPTFVTQSTVRALKDRQKAQFEALDADVKGCPSLDSRQRGAWSDFFASWREYSARDEGFWTAAAEYDEGLVFTESLGRWQTQLDGQCKLTSPRVVGNNELTDLSPIKWASVAVIAAALVYGVHSVLK